jgi:threonine/homoserine/homoserine lactone efflux protein
MTHAILQGQMFIVCTIVVMFGDCPSSHIMRRWWRLPGAEAVAEEAATVVIIGCCVVLCCVLRSR